MALDWAGTVQSVADVRQPFERLKEMTDASPEGVPLVVDSDFACELIAAAETVAMLMGRKSRDAPEELAQRLADAGEPDNLLYHQARNAVLHVLRNSELAELWEEAAQETGTNEWLAQMTGLIDRLNPELEHIPWEREDIEAKIGMPPDSAGTCAFCNRPISREELWGINLYDASNIHSIGQSFWLHLPCLSARLHHKHVIANMKFDPNDMPDLDKL